MWRKNFLDDPIKSLSVQGISIGEITGSDQAADAAKEGVAGAERIAGKNIDFQKWLWGEQKDLTQPWVTSGSAAQDALMGELGFSYISSGKQTKFTEEAPVRPTFSGDIKDWEDYEEKLSRYSDEVKAWAQRKTDFAPEDTPGTWERTGSGQFTAEDMELDPGYQFRLSEGMKGIENSAAARGMQLSGRTLKGIGRYAQDYASGEFQNAFARRQQGLSNLYNLSSMGQASASGQAVQGGMMGGNISQSFQNLSQLQMDRGSINAAQAQAPWNSVVDIASLASQFYNPSGGGSQGSRQLSYAPRG